MANEHSAFFNPTVLLLKSTPINDTFWSRQDEEEFNFSEGSDNQVLVVPVQWAAIAALIAKKIIEKLIDKLIDQMFADDAIDLHDLLAKFVELIAQVIQQKLDDRDMDIMAHQARSLQSWFRLYKYGHPPDILDKILKDAHDLTFQAERFAFRTVSTFAIVGGLELVAWSKRETADRKIKG